MKVWISREKICFNAISFWDDEPIEYDICGEVFFDVKDRDKKLCRPGFYWIGDKEKQKAIDYLKIDEAGDSASSIKSNEKFNTLNFMQKHNTKEC